MDGFIHIAAGGAKESMLAQAVNSHNLANASTPGFKADIVQAQSLYLKGAGESTRAFKRIDAIGTDFSAGSMTQTGRDLDIAVAGQGWIAVQGEGGTEGLTRRGDLRVDEFGQLRNGAGQAVMGNDGPIALPPFSSLTIGTDGTVSIVPLGEPLNAVASLDRIKLVNPPLETLSKNDAGMVQSEDGLPSQPDGSLRIATGALESSNVSTVGAMVQMIELSREFEQYMKMVTTGEEIDTSSVSLMRMQ